MLMNFIRCIWGNNMCGKTSSWRWELGMLHKAFSKFTVYNDRHKNPAEFEIQSAKIGPFTLEVTSHIPVESSLGTINECNKIYHIVRLDLWFKETHVDKLTFCCGRRYFGSKTCNSISKCFPENLPRNSVIRVTDRARNDLKCVEGP